MYTKNGTSGAWRYVSAVLVGLSIGSAGLGGWFLGASAEPTPVHGGRVGVPIPPPSSLMAYPSGGRLSQDTEQPPIVRARPTESAAPAATAPPPPAAAPPPAPVVASEPVAQDNQTGSRRKGRRFGSWLPIGR